MKNGVNSGKPGLKHLEKSRSILYSVTIRISMS